jgi:hypothetical protein
MCYLFPKLAASQVTSADNGPVKAATFDITQLLNDPDSVAKTALRNTSI